MEQKIKANVNLLVNSDLSKCMTLSRQICCRMISEGDTHACMKYAATCIALKETEIRRNLANVKFSDIVDLSKCMTFIIEVAYLAQNCQ